jgi:hypothetical protein
MNKRIGFLSFATLAFLVFSASVYAQKPELNFGPKLGANLNKVTGKSFKEEFTFGYQVGAFLELNFSKRIGIQPEVLWGETKARTSSDFEDIYQTFDPADVSEVKLSYLSIPVLLNIRPAGILSLQVGPQFGILLNKDRDLFENGREAFKSGEFSMIGGAQLNLLKFRIYGRYVIGLSEINDIPDQDKWKNQAIQVGIGLAF